MPIMSPEDASDVESRMEHIFAASPAERAGEIRALFVEVLDFDAASGHIDLGGTPAGATLPASAERVAALDGVHVVYIALDAPETDRVRKSEASAAAKRVADQLDGDLLLVFTNTSASQLHFVYPGFEGAQQVLRRMVVERDLPRRTVVEQVSNIYWKRQDTGSIRQALTQAFDVEPVTREFFKEYKRVFEAMENRITGFGAEREAKHRFVQTLFNRLMFVYFLSRKGWLTFKDDKDYLNALWADYQATEGEKKNFYIDRLRLLFFAGLNNYRSEDFTSEPETHRLIGQVPFLNGGLFEKTDLDTRDGVSVSDEAIEPILSDLFNRFNFTVMESTPFDVEVAVDPEMLGKVFEELVTSRHDSGAYYTPRSVVSFMCREALKGYLAGQNTGVSPEIIAHFVDQRDTGDIPVVSAKRIASALDEVTVVDPACGSGAYLLGMMQELVDLQTTLFNAGATPKGLYDLKLHIIQRNVYGVDIDDFAVNIARLRLWLSLAIEYEGERPEPLPNLDFKVLCGDSLLGPDPSPENYGNLFRHRTHGLAARLAGLKSRHMAATENKDALRHEIELVQDDLREALADAPAPEGVVDWRVDFVEVFSQRGGFDIAIANPPYIFGEALQPRPATYRYALAQGQFDAYWLFHERSLGSLLSQKGIHCFINSDALLARDETRIVRKYLLDHLQTMLLSHVGRVFSAGVSAVVVVGQRGPNLADHYEVVEFSEGRFAHRHCVSSIRALGDPKLRFVTRDDVDDLLGKSTIGDHCTITRGEELGKRNLKRARHLSIPDGSVGVVSGEGVIRFRTPQVTHIVPSGQVRKPMINYSSPKVLIVKTGREFKATVDYESLVTLQSIYNLHSKDYMPVEVVCAILNSRLVNTWLKYRVTDQKKLFPQITQQNVLEIPVPEFTAFQIKTLSGLVREARKASDQEIAHIVTAINDIVETAYRQVPTVRESEGIC